MLLYGTYLLGAIGMAILDRTQIYSKVFVNRLTQEEFKASHRLVFQVSFIIHISMTPPDKMNRWCRIAHFRVLIDIVAHVPYSVVYRVHIFYRGGAVV